MWLLFAFILPVVYGYSLKPDVISIKNDNGSMKATIKFKGFIDNAFIEWWVNNERVPDGDSGIETTRYPGRGINLRNTQVSYNEGFSPDEDSYFATIRIPSSFDFTSLTAKVKLGYRQATIDINPIRLNPGKTILEKMTQTTLERASPSFGCGVLSGYHYGYGR